MKNEQSQSYEGGAASEFIANAEKYPRYLEGDEDGPAYAEDIVSEVKRMRERNLGSVQSPSEIGEMKRMLETAIAISNDPEAHRLYKEIEKEFAPEYEM